MCLLRQDTAGLAWSVAETPHQKTHQYTHQLQTRLVIGQRSVVGYDEATMKCVSNDVEWLAQCKAIIPVDYCRVNTLQGEYVVSVG